MRGLDDTERQLLRESLPDTRPDDTVMTVQQTEAGFRLVRRGLAMWVRLNVPGRGAALGDYLHITHLGREVLQLDAAARGVS